jgi:3-hydroxyacyl-CoA dehydrogenase
MNMSKKLLVAATIATIGAGSLGVGIANAATNTSTANNTSIVDKLAAKFGLKKADVQAVFDQNHQDHEAQELANIQTKLTAGVKAGTITQVQSDAITAKIKELETTRDANHAKMETMTDAERKTAMDAQRTALEKWITDNKIPTEFANLLHEGGHGGRGGHGMQGDVDTSTDSTTN